MSDGGARKKNGTRRFYDSPTIGPLGTNGPKNIGAWGPGAGPKVNRQKQQTYTFIT